ncbi:hypothetical protein WJX84_005344 [Apatococcus fuscideae]|uniref:Uncharacterized protein n=1 Tax=Apatococcus fuscideae TaxID=2026836 RepID=A0AAW1TJA1_9CHLO
MQAQIFGCNTHCLAVPVCRSCTSRRSFNVQAAAAPAAAEAGNNVIGEAIKKTYGIGSDTTIRWGVLKAKVQPPPDKNGREQTWQQYRKATEKGRQQLRKEFAEKLEVIAEPERKRRLTVGIAMGVFTVILGAWLLNNGGQRLWITPTLFFSLGFIDSSIQGLCTESWAGAWDVDDTGLEYMPSKDLAERIQKKVVSLYIRDGLISTALLAAFCLV